MKIEFQSFWILLSQLIEKMKSGQNVYSSEFMTVMGVMLVQNFLETSFTILWSNKNASLRTPDKLFFKDLQKPRKLSYRCVKEKMKKEILLWSIDQDHALLSFW